MQSQVNGVNATDTPAAPQTPVAPWVNIALRALDTSVSTSQNLMEGVDRLARAGAGSEIAAQGQPPLTPALWSGPKAALACGMALATAIQRSTISLFTEGWRQWMNAIGAMTAVAVRRESAAPAGDQGNRHWTEAQPVDSTRAHGSARHGNGARVHAFAEHATASAGAKKRGTRRKVARRAK
ncbi:MAG TPA: hypothetical protein VKD22_01800 [Ramlibacter sp.]|nr:hypothetical protein [Ramlibacter sp.]